MAPKREPRDFEPTEERPIVLSSRNLAIPLWLSASITSLFLAVTTWLLSTLNTIQGDLSNMNRIMMRQWRSEHQREFVHRLARDNPTMKIPSSDEIIKSIP